MAAAIHAASAPAVNSSFAARYGSAASGRITSAASGGYRNRLCRNALPSHGTCAPAAALFTYGSSPARRADPATQYAAKSC